jgi:hypothetical protein
MEFQKTQSIRGKIADNGDSIYTMEIKILVNLFLTKNYGKPDLGQKNQPNNVHGKLERVWA